LKKSNALHKKLNYLNQLKRFFEQFLFSESRRMTAQITSAQITSAQITSAQITSAQITTAQISTAQHVRYTYAAVKS
jgi:hypothetical protein